MIHNEKYKGYKISVYQDNDPMSPDDWDSMGTIYTKHNRYFAIGHDLADFDGESVNPDGETLGIYAYVHGGVALSTTPFSCPWDSGMAGFITISRDKIIAEYGNDSAESREKARQCLKSETETWNQYLNGEVYGFIITDESGEIVDSCGGFYGDYEGYLMEEAKSIIDYIALNNEKKRLQKLKKLITAKCPIDLRESALKGV